jgi:hypothetical protein
METRFLKLHAPHLLIIVMMLGTTLALPRGTTVSVEDLPGIRMALPAVVGEWTGHEFVFCHNPGCNARFRADKLADPQTCPRCGQKLHPMSLLEYQGLPHDTTFLKSVYVNRVGELVNVSVVVSGKGRESIHPPHECIVGQGNNIVGQRVLKVSMGGERTLSVMVFDVVRYTRMPDGGLREEWSYLAYWFASHGRETPYTSERMFWMAWDQLFHNVVHKWAYIAVLGSRDKSSTAFESSLSEFVRQFYPLMSE